MFRTLAVLAAMGCSPVVAASCNYDVSMPTSGSPNPATINFDIDFDQIVGPSTGSTADLTVNSLNFIVDGGPILAYLSAGGTLVLGGPLGGAGINTVATGTNDFQLGISNPANPGTAFVSIFRMAQGGGFIAENGANATLTVTDLSSVPLPASMSLLGAALAGLAFWRRRKAA